MCSKNAFPPLIWKYTYLLVGSMLTVKIDKQRKFQNVRLDFKVLEVTYTSTLLEYSIEIKT